MVALAIAAGTAAPADPFGGWPGNPDGSQSGNSATGVSAQPVVTNAIQTDAAINLANSRRTREARGQVIGITSSIASLGSSGTTQIRHDPLQPILMPDNGNPGVAARRVLHAQDGGRQGPQSLHHAGGG